MVPLYYKYTTFSVGCKAKPLSCGTAKKEIAAPVICVIGAAIRCFVISKIR